MEILVVSDNHGELDLLDKILQSEHYDYAIHLGDSELSLKQMQSRFNFFVCGNHDDFDNNELFVNLGGLNIFLCHGHLHPNITFFNDILSLRKTRKFRQIAIALHGHTHVPRFLQNEDMMVICPGALSNPRSLHGVTYAIITIANQVIAKITFKNALTMHEIVL